MLKGRLNFFRTFNTVFRFGTVVARSPQTFRTGLPRASRTDAVRSLLVGTAFSRLDRAGFSGMIGSGFSGVVRTWVFLYYAAVFVDVLFGIAALPLRRSRFDYVDFGLYGFYVWLT